MSFEFPKFETLEELGRLNLQEIELIEFNASYSIRGLKVRFTDGQVSPFFGQLCPELACVNIKQNNTQLSKVRTTKDYSQYLHKLEFLDNKGAVYT